MTNYYVNMIDRFMSGWGPAKDGRSIYCIRCATEKQAKSAYLAAKIRKEMVGVRMSQSPRAVNKGDVRKIVDFYTLGPIWKYHISKEIQ